MTILFDVEKSNEAESISNHKKIFSYLWKYKNVEEGLTPDQNPFTKYDHF